MVDVTEAYFVMLISGAVLRSPARHFLHFLLQGQQNIQNLNLDLADRFTLEERSGEWFGIISGQFRSGWPVFHRVRLNQFIIASFPAPPASSSS